MSHFERVIRYFKIFNFYITTGDHNYILTKIIKKMKKVLLTTIVALAILFTQAQTPCDSITVSGSQYQLTFTSVSTIDFWETTASGGTILGQDSLWNMHSVYNYNPITGMPYDTIITCLYTVNTVCCETWIWNGTSWARMMLTTSIEEVSARKLIDNRTYNLLGVELTEIPVGTMYIRNNRLYMQK